MKLLLDHFRCFQFPKGVPVWFGLIGVGLLVTAVDGQDSGNPSDVDDEEIIELNPFIVDASDDDRYLSNNTTSATGLNMEIRDLPVPVTVLNREYLDDLGASDMDESLRYTAGVYTRSFQSDSTAVSTFAEASSSTIGDVNDPFQNVINIRGFDVPNQQRSGFRVGSSVPTWGIVLGGGTDDITRERMEVVRGPQALLYGINVLSGVVNIIPKRPLPENYGWASLTVGSNNYLRGSADFTGPILQDNLLNYRVMASYQEEDDRFGIQFRDNERRNVAIQFDYNPTDWLNLFVEYVDSESTARGIGAQYFTDAGDSLEFDWDNEFGENIRYGRDDPSDPVVDKFGVTWPSPLITNPLHRQYYPENGFEDLGPTFNISGPDTYRKQKERTFLALVTIAPFEDLRAEFGWYRTETEVDTFNVALRSETNSIGAVVPEISRSLPSNRRLRNTWIDNPEYFAMNGPDDDLGFGPSEVFYFPERSPEQDLGARIGWPTFSYNPANADPETVNLDKVDYKIAMYNWYRVPTSVVTDQFRGRVVYDLEHELFDIPMTHTFIGGLHYIEDEVQYIRGGPGDVDTVYSQASKERNDPYSDYAASDPLIIRNSVFDFEPIRYNGEAVWHGGIPQPVTNGYTGRDQDIVLGRSGHSEATLWFRGAYGIYTGQFWDDRLTIVAGLRQDRYQVEEREKLVVISNQGGDTFIDRFVGAAPATYLDDNGDPYFIGFGDQPWENRDIFPNLLNERIESGLEEMRTDSRTANGTIRKNFEEAQKFVTKTFGLTYQWNEQLSSYFLYSEGVFPNTGLKDGNDDAIEAEQTTNFELGLRFDLLDGKLSGSVSAYSIRRKNAAYNWSDAPNPKRWAGGAINPGTTYVANNFSPHNADPERYQTAVAKGPGNYYPRTYAISTAMLERAFAEAGEALPYPTVNGQPNPTSGAFIDYGSIGLMEARLPYSDNLRERYYLFNYEQIRADQENAMYIPFQPEFNENGEQITFPNHRHQNVVSDENRAIIRRAFEMALNNEPIRDANPDSPTYNQLIPPEGSHIQWDAFNRPQLNNPSDYTTTPTVTFEDETIGVDGQFIFSPTPNYQVIFEFSHFDRGIVGNGFNMVDPIAQDSGVNWGTEYDKWVYVLGPENFEDVTRPSTFNGNGVNGIDLSGVPTTNWSLWNRYDFREGVLENFSIGGGVNWESSVATSVRIGNTNYASAAGGSNIAPNNFPTPDRPDRFEFEAFASYKIKDFFGADWSVQVNIRNLLDDNRDIVYADYPNTYGGTERRRLEVYYPGRHFRVSVRAKF